jgi:hypothetical protein
VPARRSASVVALVVVVATALPVRALTGTFPDDTWMVNARVRAVERAGGLIWLGGTFTSLLDASGDPVSPVTGLTALTAAGTPANVSPPAFADFQVWDMQLGPDGVLYVAGGFTYTSGGKTYRNLVGLDPSTGKIVHAYRTALLRSVFTDGRTVWAGGVKLNAYDVATGALVPGFVPVEILVDDSLRAHTTAEAIRDMATWGPWIVATGQFDFVKIGGAWDPQKVFFRFGPATGEVDPDWAPADIRQSGAAWGQEVLVDDGVLFNAAGGSDYVAAYDLTGVDTSGRAPKIWHTDTSGSAQALALWDARTLIVGGHFQWVEDEDTQQCGSNQTPNTDCWYQPRLAAFETSQGRAIQTWTPSVCCLYNGVWATLVEGTRLHIGGEFTKVGGIEQRYYARLTEPT